MGNKWERILSEAIGIYGVHINSALVSAQNRKRIYWTNIRTKQVGLFGELHADIPQPKDESILLRDVLERDVPEKYYLSDTALTRAFRKEYSQPQLDPEKTGTLNTKNNGPSCSFDSGSTFISVDGKSPTQRSSTGRSFDKKHNYQFINQSAVLNDNGFLKETETSSCIDANYHKGMDNHAQRTMICVSMVGRKLDENGTRKDNDPGIKAVQRLEPNLSGKTNCLTSVQKDNLVMQLNPSKESGGKQPYQGNRVYDSNGIYPALMTEIRGSVMITHCNYRYDEGIRVKQDGKTGASTGSATDDESCGQLVCISSMQKHATVTVDKSSPMVAAMGMGGGQVPMVNPNSRIRRLTPTEVARLQTVPDWYVWACSDTQIYRMCGNGWTIKVIMHILRF